MESLKCIQAWTAYSQYLKWKNVGAKKNVLHRCYNRGRTDTSVEMQNGELYFLYINTTSENLTPNIKFP
jgi:hypothetical protein